MIYFMKPCGMPGPIKIGFSNAVDRRLRTLMSWSPFELEIILTTPGDIATERKVHNHFADAHSHCEWFHPIPRLLAAIRAIQAGAAISEAVNLEEARGSVLSMAQMRTRRSTGKAKVRQSA